MIDYTQSSDRCWFVNSELLNGVFAQRD